MEASFVMVASHKANADGPRAATWWFLLQMPRGRVGKECWFVSIRDLEFPSSSWTWTTKPLNSRRKGRGG